jgi:hypothetical protein
MHRISAAIALISAAALLGCKTGFHSGEPGPDGTLAYYFKVESSVPGAGVETNHVFAGKTPLTLKVFGDYPGTFHDFGGPEFVLRVTPENTNEFIQTRIFRTGHGSAPGDNIPGLVFVDLSQPGGGVIIDSTPDR